MSLVLQFDDLDVTDQVSGLEAFEALRADELLAVAGAACPTGRPVASSATGINGSDSDPICG